MSRCREFYKVEKAEQRPPCREQRLLESIDNLSNPTEAAAVLVTVAICTRNRRQRLLQAVESVVPQLSGETELLIIDNGSTDGTDGAIRELQQTDARIRYEPAPGKGIASARNVALLKAHGSHVLFLDDDELAGPDWLKQYLRFLERHSSSRIAAVGGPYVARHLSPAPRWVRQNYGVFDLRREEGVLPYGESPAGGNSAYHRVRALDVGGFSEVVRRGEDSELTLRLQTAGWEVWWLPTAVVYHLISAERFRVKYQMKVAFEEGIDRAQSCGSTFTPRKWYPLYVAGRVLVAPVHFVLLLLISVYRAFRGDLAFAVESLVKISRYSGMVARWFTVSHWRSWFISGPRFQPIPKRAARAR